MTIGMFLYLSVIVFVVIDSYTKMDKGTQNITACSVESDTLDCPYDTNDSVMIPTFFSPTNNVKMSLNFVIENVL